MKTAHPEKFPPEKVRVTAADLDCRVAPSTELHIGDSSQVNSEVLDGKAQCIVNAFSTGTGSGLLHLGAAEAETQLHPTLSWWRDFAKYFVTSVCTNLDPLQQNPLEVPELELAEEQEQQFLGRIPPMQGAEFVTRDALQRYWQELSHTLNSKAAAHKQGVQGYLKQQSSLWHVVGRVCLHLAENKGNTDRPFAFMATYVDGVSQSSRARHMPLGRALEEYAGAGSRRKLLALLAPLSRAAEESALLNELLDSGDVYHPLAWSAQEAWQFLKETELYRQAGLVVRLPQWWNKSQGPRAKVSISIGDKKPGRLGMKALLDFQVSLSLDGQKLSQKEIKDILAASEGLVLIKGQWVEVDPGRLAGLLDQWQGIQLKAQDGGIPFGEAMRLLSGTQSPVDHGWSGLESLEKWTDVIAGKWLTKKLDSLRSPQVKAAIKNNAGLQAELRPYQKSGVQWLMNLRSLELGACLADDMGLGKTIQVLAMLNLCKGKKEQGTDLLIVPASLLDNWRQEIERFAPGLRVLLAHSSQMASSKLKRLHKKQIELYDAVITSYATAVRSDWMAKFHWRNLILDEAQAIKNPGTRQTRGVKALQSDWRLALTGTPVENRLGDLWSLLDFLNPGLLGTAKAFGRNCTAMSKQQRGYAPLRKLIQPYLLRRLKTDKSIIHDLPDKSEVTAHCLLTRQQAALYQQTVDYLQEALQPLEGIQRRGVVLACLTRFKQICNHPSQWLGDGAYEAKHSGKFARLREICESICARQEKVLIFTQYREMTAPLAGFLAGVFGRSGIVLHGGTPVKKRQQLVRSFQQDEERPFMVLSLKAGGTGLNLTAASHVIHFDRWWNPAVENQATDRAYRIGQHKNVLVHKFVCRGTIEEQIAKLIADKQTLAGDVLGSGAEKILTELSNDELLSLVSLDLSAALEDSSRNVRC